MMRVLIELYHKMAIKTVLEFLGEMGDAHDGGSILPGNRPNAAYEPLSVPRVETGEGFVQKEEVRVFDQSTGEKYEPLLSEG